MKENAFVGGVESGFRTTSLYAPRLFRRLMTLISLDTLGGI
jgi:hypothetical protein